jgi:hypothetical protein
MKIYAGDYCKSLLKHSSFGQKLRAITDTLHGNLYALLPKRLQGKSTFNHLYYGYLLWRSKVKSWWPCQDSSTLFTPRTLLHWNLNFSFGTTLCRWTIPLPCWNSCRTRAWASMEWMNYAGRHLWQICQIVTVQGLYGNTAWASNVK